MDFLKLLFGRKKKLLDEATSEAVVSLENGKAMFLKVMRALQEEVNGEVVRLVKEKDREINEHQMHVRRIVFTHLSMSEGKDLYASLVLLSVVIDTERIGDYIKNIAELIEYFPRKMEFSEFEELFQKLKGQTTELFDLTKEAFERADEDKAKQVMDRYGQLSPLCDSTIKKIVVEKASSGTVETSYMVLVLMLRHMKRVAAHLKNIASAVVNPFDRIGYKLKE